MRLYADEGKTGTSTKKRKEFLKMISDCESGKIDLVITKSVSRFGRNTLDGLQNVRKLKRIGIGVYFEKENVNTLYMDNEMILTFFFSQAQAESESLSGNVKWGHRKNFRDGKVYYQYESFLGYRKGPDGSPEIDEEQAEIVHRIFSRYLMGDSVSKICHDLEGDGIKTVRGKDKWSASVVQGMLQNEKYVGDALLQKTYIADLFTHQSRKNMGELPKYYVHDGHPAIIDRATFQKVQGQLARRSSKKKTSSKAKTELGKYSGKYALSELLICGECGSPYRRTTYMPKGEKIFVWRCLNRLERGRRVCKHSPTFTEGSIHDSIISAMNEMFRQQEAKDVLRESIVSALAGQEDTLSLPALESRLRAAQEEMSDLLQNAFREGSKRSDFDERIGSLNRMMAELLEKKTELQGIEQESAEFDRRMAEIDAALAREGGAITEYEDVRVRQLVSNIKVIDKERLLVRFRDGTEIEQRIEMKKGVCEA